MTGLGIVLSTTSNVLVIAALDTALTRDGVLEAFARREDDEMAEPVFVPGDAHRRLSARDDRLPPAGGGAAIERARRNRMAPAFSIPSSGCRCRWHPTRPVSYRRR
ncbi:MAG: hypothetical protein WDM86_21400 [Rhizomicrobium sp.]